MSQRFDTGNRVEITDPSTPNRSVAGRTKNSLLLLLALAASFGLAELVSRALLTRAVPQFVPSRDFHLIYELNPAFPEINSLGMRDDELDISHLHERFVIAVVGDSHTYSIRSQNRAHSFPARLQHHLTVLAGQPVTVLNFGVPGYNTVQEVAVLQHKVLPLKPDLVVLQYTINDEHISNYIQPKYKWFNTAVNHSMFLTSQWTRLLYSDFGQAHLVPLVERHAADLLLFAPGLVGTERTRDTDPAHMWPHPPRSMDQVPPRYHDFIGRANLERAVRAFGLICRTEHIPIIATGFIEDSDESLFVSSGFQVYSFLEIFEGLRMQDYGYDPTRTATHFKDNGSDVIGKALAQFITLHVQSLLRPVP